MAALAACDDSPVGPSWVEVSQGAEARVYRLEVFGVAAVAKHRFKKTYRLEAVDLKLRKERTVAEARCLARCSDLGLPVPAVLVADTARYTLYLEFVPGPTAKRFVDAHRTTRPAAVADVLARFGRAVAALHDHGITHGDLTTSNVIVEPRDGGGGGDETDFSRVVLIDFGLGSMSATAEDKAVDLYVLERALVSTHKDADDLLQVALDAYAAASTGAPAVVARLDAVRARGRKRECFG